jgi:NAD(P)-dependent dehydrogenase (short-subunit alcohol dehydrogenase family)
MRLKDKICIITGGASGIGAACAHVFAREGAKVVVADIHTPTETVDALYLEGDVSTKAGAERLVSSTLKHHGRIDVLLNNAGITHAADFLDLAEEDFDRVLRVNLKGMFLCGQAVAREMVKAQTRGAIINMSSVNAVLAIPNQVPYVVSKGGVNQLTKVMAMGLAPHGIRVNGIGPGTIATELAKKAVLGSEAAKAKVMSRTPMGRLGEPEEVANVALFLASEESSYLTGQTIYPDGGRLALNYTVG